MKSQSKSRVIHNLVINFLVRVEMERQFRLVGLYFGKLYVRDWNTDRAVPNAMIISFAESEHDFLAQEI